MKNEKPKVAEQRNCDELNSYLRRNGFIGISEQEEAGDMLQTLYNTMMEILEDCEKRGQVMDQLSTEKSQLQQVIPKYKQKILEINADVKEKERQVVIKTELQSQKKSVEDGKINLYKTVQI